MYTRYIFNETDSVSLYIDTIDFDPLAFLLNIDENATMGWLFDYAKHHEGDPLEDKSVRYLDDDACFEIRFHYLDGGIGMIGYTDEVHEDWETFFVKDGKCYLLTAEREL